MCSSKRMRLRHAIPPLASWERFRSLLPCILGLTCARLGLIVGSYGSYSATDEGFFTDGSMLVTLVFIFVGLLLISRVESFVGKRIVNTLFHLSVIGEALSLVALVACASLGGGHLPLCRQLLPDAVRLACHDMLASSCTRREQCDGRRVRLRRLGDKRSNPLPLFAHAACDCMGACCLLDARAVPLPCGKRAKPRARATSSLQPVQQAISACQAPSLPARNTSLPPLSASGCSR